MAFFRPNVGILSFWGPGNAARKGEKYGGVGKRRTKKEEWERNGKEEGKRGAWKNSFLLLFQGQGRTMKKIQGRGKREGGKLMEWRGG